MKVVFDIPDYHMENGVYPWEVDDVVTYLFLPISKKDGKFIAPFCVGIGKCDPDPLEEYIQNKMEQYYKGIREDMYKFVDEFNVRKAANIPANHSI